jgi:hypothetical protein
MTDEDAVRHSNTPNTSVEQRTALRYQMPASESARPH